LPCLLFTLSSYQAIRRLSELGWFKHFAASDITVRATTFLAVAGALAVFFALANTFLIRRLEGYGWPFNKLPILRDRQLNGYRDVAYKIEDYDDNWEDFLAAGPAALAKARNERNRLLRSMVADFPDNENDVLPTSVGNIIRAFEVYPRVTYGLDSIPGWPRLLGVIPDGYLKHAHDSKAKLDFCVNSIYLAGGLLLTIIICMLWSRQPAWLVFWFVADVFLIFLLWKMIKHAAISWGNFIKSCFDLYIDDLAGQLGYSAPLSKETWANITQAFLFPDELPPKPRRSQLGKR
jgi:hypothetical protein